MRPPSFAIWAASICALLGAAVARAQAPQAPAAPPQGPPIVRSIDVEYTGRSTVSKERILAQIRTRVGQPYSNEVVEQDIAALYKTGAIQNVRIFAQWLGQEKGDKEDRVGQMQLLPVAQGTEICLATIFA